MMTNTFCHFLVFLCLALVYYHNVPLYIGIAASVHGLPDSVGAHVEEEAIWTFPAYPK